MVSFDKESMSEKMITQLGNFLNDPAQAENLKEENVKNGSEAAYSMLLWAKALYSFYFVNKKVKPKKAALQVANEKVNKLNSELSVK